MDKLTGRDILFVQAATEEESHNFCLHATPLEAFKLSGPAAPIVASFTLFNELAADKSISLLSGRFDSGRLNATQAAQLVERFLAAYGNEAALPRTFNENPGSFDLESYLVQ